MDLIKIFTENEQDFEISEAQASDILSASGITSYEGGPVDVLRKIIKEIKDEITN